MKSLYKRFIKPLSKNSDQAEREVVLNSLLVGILILSVVALADTVLVFVITRQSYLPSRILTNTVTVLFILGLYWAARYGKLYRAVAFALTLLITAFGAFVVYQWGVLNPNGLLLLALAIVMAGILINARYSLYLTGATAVILLVLQRGETHHYFSPDLSWVGTQPTVGDMVGFAAILGVIAFVSWLFNRQMEGSLRRARRSEKALQHQRDLLEVKVKERTQQLEASQLEQMQELYRFAELGRLSTALFHDLANHLANVSVDIEGLQAEHQSEIMQRIQNNVRHVDSVVQRVRQQIQGKTSVEVFSVLQEVNEVIKLLTFSAIKAEATIVLEDNQMTPALQYKGDITRFRQILLNTIANGLEAYESIASQPPASRVVVVHLEHKKRRLHISVTDHGVGIAADRLSKIFEPFYSTKPKGVGIGLFIVKQVVEQDFKGSLSVTSSPAHGTTISVSLPGGYYARKLRS